MDVWEIFNRNKTLKDIVEIDGKRFELTLADPLNVFTAYESKNNRYCFRITKKTSYLPKITCQGTKNNTGTLTLSFTQETLEKLQNRINLINKEHGVTARERFDSFYEHPPGSEKNKPGSVRKGCGVFKMSINNATVQTEDLLYNFEEPTALTKYGKKGLFIVDGDAIIMFDGQNFRTPFKWSILKNTRSRGISCHSNNIFVSFDFNAIHCLNMNPGSTSFNLPNFSFNQPSSMVSYGCHLYVCCTNSIHLLSFPINDRCKIDTIFEKSYARFIDIAISNSGYLFILGVAPRPKIWIKSDCFRYPIICELNGIKNPQGFCILEEHSETKIALLVCDSGNKRVSKVNIDFTNHHNIQIYSSDFFSNFEGATPLKIIKDNSGLLYCLYGSDRNDKLFQLYSNEYVSELLQMESIQQEEITTLGPTESDLNILGTMLSNNPIHTQ